ncbi:DMT family transporter [Roseicella frigidaeris]|uniref:Multidrug transporter n=1 Tax=Roseicella frigidaeris TaxID=2230885 RepID=A0A327MAA5_9PROT|nr:EamA family transporter [Roseicella frigidaeris]RAI60231.1 multidrug transporter [Roseicella frigidaeris]
MTLYWTALAAAILTSLLGQVLLKTGAVEAEGGLLAQLLRPSTLCGLAAYAGAAFLYIIALRRIPVSIALPSTAASYVAVALLGHFLFGERLSMQKLAAIALICGGVLMLAAA